MKIETDTVQIISGVRWGKTTGAPICLMILNKDFENWRQGMSIVKEHANSIPPVTKPRPGHADLAGVLKYCQHDARNILERSSARETAMRVALGAVAKILLRHFDITIGSFVYRIGSACMDIDNIDTTSQQSLISAFDAAEGSILRCPDKAITDKMITQIDNAIAKGDTVGGEFAVFACCVPVGLGSHVQWDRKLDARLAYYITSIQAIKGVAFGKGFDFASVYGSSAMDEIFYDKVNKQFYRQSNHAGGIEGGMSNGMPIFLRAVMKPIPTLRKALRSVDLLSKEPFEAAYERSDTCAVPAASVVAEAMTALCLADAFLQKFGSDSLQELTKNYESYLQALRDF